MFTVYSASEAEILYEKLKSRADSLTGEVADSASEIVEAVKNCGDEKIIEYTLKYDKIKTTAADFFMSPAELSALYAKCPAGLIKTMEKAAENITEYHKKQLQNSYIQTSEGKITGQRVLPLESAALYTPGGSAFYPSSVLMNAIPAKIAGVKRLTILTPPKKDGINPAIAAAAKICGVDEILKIGGAQAVAAAAYGTETIKRSDKIVGPGNAYVAAAKKIVFGAVDIDMVAGPSEILIIADKGASPAHIAADLMSQAEHDANASVILLTDAEEIIEKTAAELERQIKTQPRAEIIRASIGNYGFAVRVRDIFEALEISNKVAPEHLELAVSDPFLYLDYVKNAGSVFMGYYTPEPLGDYFAGTNHVLPTYGTARFSSPLGVESFVKKSSFLFYSKERFLEDSADVILFAESERLFAHANSVKVRME